MNAVKYTRVSTTKQGTEGVSLEVQSEKINSYANYKGLLLSNSRKFSDTISGSGKVEREGFDRMLHEIDTNDSIKHVIVYSLSRFTRSTRELLDFVDKYVLTGRVELHSVVENLDTSSPTGRFMLKVMGAMNELEREQIVERTQAAIDHKRSKGEKLGGYVPYGYTVEGKSLVLHPDEQATITTMRTLYEEGNSFNGIARVLNEAGVLSRNKVQWSHVTVSRVLRRA